MGGFLFQAPISIQAVHENPVVQSQRSSELREVLRAQILVAGHDRNPRGFFQHVQALLGADSWQDHFEASEVQGVQGSIRVGEQPREGACTGPF